MVKDLESGGMEERDSSGVGLEMPERSFGRDAPSGQESLVGFLVNHNREGPGDSRKVVILKVVEVLCFEDLWQVFILDGLVRGRC